MGGELTAGTGEEKETEEKKPEITFHPAGRKFQIWTFAEKTKWK